MAVEIYFARARSIPWKRVCTSPLDYFMFWVGSLHRDDGHVCVNVSHLLSVLVCLRTVAKLMFDAVGRLPPAEHGVHGHA